MEIQKMFFNRPVTATVIGKIGASLLKGFTQTPGYIVWVMPPVVKQIENELKGLELVSMGSPGSNLNTYRAQLNSPAALSVVCSAISQELDKAGFHIDLHNAMNN